MQTPINRLLSLLSFGTYHREVVYRSGDFSAWANRSSPMYATQKNLLLEFKGMLEIAPQWGLVGFDLPYRSDIYGDAPVHYFPDGATQMQLRPDMEPWPRQTRMLYFETDIYARAQFDHIVAIMTRELPILDNILLHHEDETFRKMATYQIAGLVYGDIDDFTAIYTDGTHSLQVRPDGTVLGVELVSSTVGETVQIVVGDRETVDVAALLELKNPRTQRRLRDDFPVVVQEYISASSTYSEPEIISTP